MQHLPRSQYGLGVLTASHESSVGSSAALSPRCGGEEVGGPEELEAWSCVKAFLDDVTL